MDSSLLLNIAGTFLLRGLAPALHAGWTPLHVDAHTIVQWLVADGYQTGNTNCVESFSRGGWAWKHRSTGGAQGDIMLTLDSKGRGGQHLYHGRKQREVVIRPWQPGGVAGGCGSNTQ